MNKMKVMALVTLMGIIGVFAAFGQSELNLDTAIQQAGKTVNDSLFVGVKVALLNCGSGSNDLSKYVVDKMTATLDSGRKVTLITGKDVDRVRGDMNLQLSSEINDTPALELGRKLGAAIVVTGSFVKNGNGYRYTVRALDVNTKALQKTSSFNVKDDQQVRQLLGIKETVAASPAPTPVPALASTPVPAPVAAPTPAPTPKPATAASTAYKIGDTGPAGGVIFYDKGSNSEGWRYLEAAPDTAEFQATWSDNAFYVNDDTYKTRKEVGYGKRNTQFIVDKFRQTTGNWNTAAQKAHDFSFNGFEDWFLPSQGELDLIFGNLKRKNLVDFKNEWYWSSTEDGYYNSYCQNFRDGKVNDRGKNNNCYVRPIRQLAGQ
jgi:hypothetical protein